MEGAEAETVPVPPQLKPPRIIDFRFATLGPTGYRATNKRKMDEYADQAEEESARMQDDGAEWVVGPVAKKQKSSTVGLAKKSGRSWKEAARPVRESLRSPILATSWEKKMADKAAKQGFKERRDAVVETRKAKKKEEAERRAAAKTRKEENQRKSAIVQKVTKASTLKKMMKSKKMRKKLMTSEHQQLTDKRA